MQIDADRMWSKANEAAVLGSMVLGPECIPAVLERLSAGDFVEPAHRDVFDAIVKAWGRKRDGEVDGLLVRNQLEDSQALRDAGGLDYYRDILETVPSSANALYYANEVVEKSRYRQLVKTCQQVQETLDEPLPVAEQVQKAQDLILSLEVAEDRPTHFSFGEQAEERAVRMFDASDAVPTGYMNIDHIIRGVKPGQFVIIAARPAMGKSALALGMALRMAKAGRSIVFFSLEMTHKELIDRSCGIWGHVNVQAIQSHGLDPAFEKEREKVYSAARDIKGLNIVVEESADTVQKQLAFIRAWRRRYGVDVVFVDYLQLMSLGRRGESRLQEITEISRKLKRLAMQEQLPIVALSQLNRACETREKHRPRLSDLRESGSIEQDADVVTLLHREDYYRRAASPDAPLDGLAEVIVAKNRNGPIRTAKLTFLDGCTSFEDLLNCDE